MSETPAAEMTRRRGNPGTIGTVLALRTEAAPPPAPPPAPAPALVHPLGTVLDRGATRGIVTARRRGSLVVALGLLFTRRQGTIVILATTATTVPIAISVTIKSTLNTVITVTTVTGLTAAIRKIGDRVDASRQVTGMFKVL